MGSVPERTEAAAGSVGRILVVDDMDDVRRGLRRMLSLAGHVVEEAADGGRAVELLGREHFDLVVTDVHMPDMGGVELLRRIHQLDPDLPVLLLSGAPDIDSAMRAVEYGALEYLEKPVSLQKLRTSAARAVELRRQRLAARAASHVSGERPRVSGERPRTPDVTEGLEGKLLGGRYRVGSLLGAGGMGAVYEGAREDLAHMPVAIKVLHAWVGADGDCLSRFRREAHLLATIDHPNIVRVIDFQAPQDEPAFIVMERLHGHSLADAIRRERRFSVEEAAWIGVQVLAALAAAHGARVVHRDLKPDNVFLTSMAGMTDVVKLLDFGVAKLTNAPTDEKLTQTGTVMGTPSYMAPEQARGEAADARSDLYAFGCLLFETLTGQPPFAGSNYNALMFQISQGEPLVLRELRPDLDQTFAAVVAKAMARDMGARFQSADELAEALSHWVGRGPSSPAAPQDRPLVSQ
jgi:CheY-like chemotaxis protein